MFIFFDSILFRDLVTMSVSMLMFVVDVFLRIGNPAITHHVRFCDKLVS